MNTIERVIILEAGRAGGVYTVEPDKTPEEFLEFVSGLVEKGVLTPLPIGRVRTYYRLTHKGRKLYRELMKKSRQPSNYTEV
jgi:hypothetical protein